MRPGGGYDGGVLKDPVFYTPPLFHVSTPRQDSTNGYFVRLNGHNGQR